MVNFILPGFYEHFIFYQRMFAVLDYMPEVLREDIQVGAAYGNFQLCSWDGGRIFVDYVPASYEKMIEVREFWEKRNIPIRLIYTNPVLEKKYFYERKNNLATALCENENNEIVVNNSELEKYLKQTYPRYKKYISSTTKCISKPEDSLKEIAKSYYMVCLDYNLNKNFKFLDSIPEENRNKVEFLVDAICPPGCPNRKKHYEMNGISVLNGGLEYTVDECGIKQGINSKSCMEYKNNISPDELYNTYVPKGFINFKLEGRTLPWYSVLLSISRYMIKPEYQWQFLEAVLQECDQGHQNVLKLK